MHPFFENLAIINALGLWAFLMDIHHDTSLKFILEDNFISLVFRVRICFSLGKGARL
jgi:hypothetical protein